MHDTGFLLPALIYLGAAALFVPLFQRIGLGSVLGYLVAGLAIGPWGANLITDTEVVRQVSELGVVLLMFLVGLELNPARLWSLRRAIFGLGTLQVVTTIAAVALFSKVVGASWQAAIVYGMAASMSSTAIALQILGERHLMKAPPGQASFAVSLFQDLAVIPLLLGLAFMSPQPGEHDGFSWTPVLTAVGLIVAMVAAGRLLLRPLLRWIAGIRMREVFIAFALLLIVGSALLTQSVGLSMAMGSFIAGLLLADSEYRMELEVDIDPFKGLLLGLFFIAVGMSIDVGLVLAQPLKVFALAAAVVLLKFALLRGLGMMFKLCREDGWMFGLSLSQVGEFAFVLLQQGEQTRLLTGQQAALANAVVAVSMLSTPLLFILFDRVVAPRLAAAKAPREADVIDERNGVIIAGMGRFGQVVARMLIARGIKATIIDHDPNQIDLIRRFGFRAWYGDARRPDVLESAGIEQAQLVVLAMDDTEAVLAAAEHIRHEHPKVKLIARARGRTDALELERRGIPTIRETLGSALDAAQDALIALGDEPQAAANAAKHFRAHDRRLFQAQLENMGDTEKLIAISQQGRADFEKLLAREFGSDRGSEAANDAALDAGGDASPAARTGGDATSAVRGDATGTDGARR